MSGDITLPSSAGPSSTGPSSRGMERDARRLADSHHVAPGEIAIGVVIGRTSEFFDFFVYAIASVLVFPQLFFPGYDKVTGTLFSFAVFALAFIARPIGSVIFMAVDRRYGRGVKLTIALFMLGGSTAAIAFLPGFSQIGPLSIWLLSACRIGQGLALGGAWDGLASLLALNAPKEHRGWWAMMPQLGAPLGLLLASALFTYFVLNLSSPDFLDWGWRFPFFVAFAVNVVALFARLRLVVTTEFATLLERRELEPTPVGEMLKTEAPNVVIGAFAPLASFALFHMVTVFPLSWVFLFTKEGSANFLELEMVGCVVGLMAIAASGSFADRIGRRRLLGLSAIGIAVFSVFAPLLLSAGGMGEVIFMMIGFALLGISFGQAAGAVTSNFPPRYRYTGAALTSDLAWLVGAGFAPLVALALSAHFGLISSGAYLLSGAIGTIVALAVNKRLEGQEF
jgi:MFS family permease